MNRKKVLIGFGITVGALAAIVPGAMLIVQSQSKCTPAIPLPPKIEYNENIDLILNNYKDKFKWAYSGDTIREQQFVPNLWNNLRDDINRAIEEKEKNKV